MGYVGVIILPKFVCPAKCVLSEIGGDVIPTREVGSNGLVNPKTFLGQ